LVHDLHKVFDLLEAKYGGHRGGARRSVRVMPIFQMAGDLEEIAVPNPTEMARCAPFIVRDFRGPTFEVTAEHCGGACCAYTFAIMIASLIL
jgi:hypothetical protein